MFTGGLSRVMKACGVNAVVLEQPQCGARVGVAGGGRVVVSRVLKSRAVRPIIEPCSGRSGVNRFSRERT